MNSSLIWLASRHPLHNIVMYSTYSPILALGHKIDICNAAEASERGCGGVSMHERIDAQLHGRNRLHNHTAMRPISSNHRPACLFYHDRTPSVLNPITRSIYSLQISLSGNPTTSMWKNQLMKQSAVTLPARNSPTDPLYRPLDGSRMKILSWTSTWIWWQMDWYPLLPLTEPVQQRSSVMQQWPYPKLSVWPTSLNLSIIPFDIEIECYQYLTPNLPATFDMYVPISACLLSPNTPY